jgi:energy-coupling factor transporter transmembrane protein EcfT
MRHVRRHWRDWCVVAGLFLASAAIIVLAWR